MVRSTGKPLGEFLITWKTFPRVSKIITSASDGESVASWVFSLLKKRNKLSFKKQIRKVLSISIYGGDCQEQGKERFQKTPCDVLRMRKQFSWTNMCIRVSEWNNLSKADDVNNRTSVSSKNLYALQKENSLMDVESVDVRTDLANDECLERPDEKQTREGLACSTWWTSLKIDYWAGLAILGQIIWRGELILHYFFTEPKI